MGGLFSGLELGKRALTTHQLWLNTIGHNIANVDTPGYSRQTVTITTTTPDEHYAGLVGTGVKATSIRNIRDLFLTQQYRNENKSLGQWTAKEKTLTQIENTFLEPNEGSLSDLIEQFWTSWMDLESDPESIAARTSLKENTILMTTSFNQLYSQLIDQRKSVETDIEALIQQVNVISDEIAELNQDIYRAELGGDHANDMRDRRDYLIDQLSQYIDVNTSEQDNGAVIVYIGALTLIDEQEANHLGTKERRATSAGNVLVSDIVWEGTTKVIKNLDGELKGLFDTRDEVIPSYMEELDELARILIAEVNALHSTGYDLNGDTGIDFFDETYLSAENITLSQEILNDVSRIAASISGAIGDNANALAIADLRNSLLMNDGTATLDEFYNTIVGRIGSETSKATQIKENQTLLVEQLENSRQSVQGVSLDEEMTQMIKYQHAYDAAARVITTIDEALSTVIEKMGIVGRS